MGKSKIEWTQKVWNPVTGCTKVSEGCRNCYAERMSKRFAGRGRIPEDGFKVTLHPERLNEPLRWKKPSRIFVCSMGDLFHKDVPLSFILKVFDRMEQAKQHTFIVLTKRPGRLLEFCATYGIGSMNDWPSNIMAGVSVEDQATANERIPLLLQTPAAKRFVSYEPALGPVDFSQYFGCTCGDEEKCHGCPPYISHGAKRLDWLIMGGESGPGARPMHPDWARSVRDQCKIAGVPFFFKQWGEWAPTMNVEYLNTATRQIEVCETALKDGFPYKTIMLNNKRISVKDGMFRVGKKAAGCLLDGKEHKETL